MLSEEEILQTKKDVFCTAPKKVIPLVVEAVEMNSNEIHQILAKKEYLALFLARYKSSEFYSD